MEVAAAPEADGVGALVAEVGASLVPAVDATLAPEFAGESGV